MNQCEELDYLWSVATARKAALVEALKSGSDCVAAHAAELRTVLQSLQEMLAKVPTKPEVVKTAWDYIDYSQWSRQLAADCTMAELQREVDKCEAARTRLARSHLSAVEATGSMAGASARRAGTRASMTGNMERLSAFKDAIEIQVIFPGKGTNKEEN